MFSFFKISDSLECEGSSVKDLPDGCTILNSDIAVLPIYDYTFALLSQKLSTVKRINGRVGIIGTEFKNFSFLSSLETISYRPKEDFKSHVNVYGYNAYQHALRIESNPYLEKLQMDKLDTISIDVLPTDKQYYATSFFENPKLCFESSQTERWMKSVRVRIPQYSYCKMNLIEESRFYKKYTLENDSRIFCSMEWFNGSMPMGCQVLDTGIWIKNYLNETELEYFSIAIQSVELIMGPIIVKNSTIKSLNFKNLTTIYNMHYDVTEIDGGWTRQAMQFINNDIFTELLFPKLKEIYHFGPEAFVMTSGNAKLDCARGTCDVFLHLFRFDLNSCACGIIPKFNDGYEISYLLIVIFESILCASLTILTYGNIMYHVYKTGFSVSYFQFSMLVYLGLSCIEAVYNVVNNIKFFDGLNYPWNVGIQFLMFSNRESYFFQAVNIIYTNRISLLLSCCLYRTISFISFDYGKIAMAISFMIFIFSNIWSFNGLLQNGSQWSYGIYLINWATLLVSIVTSIFLFFYLAKYFKSYPEMIQHQNRLSVAFFSQALLSFVFCGFPDGIFEEWIKDNYNLELARSRRVFSYYYSSTFLRWHYLAYAILLRIFLHDMISKVNIRSTAAVATSIRDGNGSVGTLSVCSEFSAMKFLALFFALLCSATVYDATDCFVKFPLSQLPDNCTTMTGDLVVDGKNMSNQLVNHLQYPVLQQKLSRVEHWTGSIKILNTDFQNFSFFNSLKTIKAEWPDIIFDANLNYAAFWVEANPNLTALGMPSLVNIQADVLPTDSMIYSFIIRENYNLCMFEQEYLRLRTLERSFMFHLKLCEITAKKYCVEEFFTSTNVPLGCQVLMSGIWLRDVTNTSLQTHLNNAFSTVEEVHGPIVIFRTDFTNLSFPLLHTIRNQYYDGQNSWQWQVLIIRGNYFLTDIQFPKLRNFHHYGIQPQLTNSANSIWKYQKENCDTFRRIPFFSVTDTFSNCGLIPIINNGEITLWLVAQFAEKAASLLVNFVLCAYLAAKMFKSNISVNFFHFAIVTLICLTITENLYVNLDHVHIFNNDGFAIPFGVRSLFLSHDSILFNQISNIMYVNRLSLLMSCSIYRSLYLSSPYNEKYGLLVACATFVLSNVWNLSVMENFENKYTYVLYQLNWITLLVTLISAIFTKALWTFLFFGYSEGLNKYFAKNYQFIRMVHWYDRAFYWYGGVVIRWHYSMLIIIITAFLPSTFVKFPQSAKVTTMGSTSRN